jgi:hypothetical protein
MGLLTLLLLVVPWPGSDHLDGQAAEPMGREISRAKQSPEEAAKALLELMKERKAVAGLTTRGQSLEDAPPFKVLERKSDLYYFPCSDCHDAGIADIRVRKLKDEHPDLAFDHGGGRFWCYDACHNKQNMDTLTSLRGEPIDYDESYKLCGQCHFERIKDWSFGGHGKRAGAFPDSRKIPLGHDELLVKERKKIGTWQGERTLLNCTACHDAHSPSIKPFEPSPPPEVRKGLERPDKERPTHVQIWTELSKELKEAK